MKSVYVHIPFCSSICTYCDFCKLYYDKTLIKTYLKALELEITNIYNGEPIRTIYIGGGTPSVLDMEDLKHLFEILKILLNLLFKYSTSRVSFPSINTPKGILS